MTIGDTTMKIYKWVPISTSEQKKKGKELNHHPKENGISRKSTVESSNSNFTLAEDSNTCKFSCCTGCNKIGVFL